MFTMYMMYMYNATLLCLICMVDIMQPFVFILIIYLTIFLYLGQELDASPC